VNVSSRAHYGDTINFFKLFWLIYLNILFKKKDFGMNWSDINWEKKYSPIRAYAQSKLANILFTKELAIRLKGKRGLNI